MAITLGTIAGTNNGAGSAATCTHASFLTAGGIQALLVRTYARSISGTVWTGVTWNGGAEAFTQIAVVSDGSLRLAIWILMNPTATTADIVATYNGTHTGARVSVQTVTGLDPVTPYGSPGSSSGTTSCSVTAAIGDTVVDCTGIAQASGTQTEGAGQTVEEANTTLGGSTYYGSSSRETAAGTSVTMSWTPNSSGTRAVCGIALKPDPSGGGVGTLFGEDGYMVFPMQNPGIITTVFG